MGIFYLTYSFFLTNNRRTADETYRFFYKTILLHAVQVRRSSINILIVESQAETQSFKQDPPKSLEIFTPEECALSLEFFSAILMTHLPLVCFVSLPNYRCTVPDTLTGTGSNQ